MNPQLSQAAATVMSIGLTADPIDQSPLATEEQATLLRWASTHRLLPLLEEAADEGLALSQAIRAELDKRLLVEHQNMLRLEAALLRLIGELDANQLDYRVLKGMATGRLVYPGEAWRQSGDLDLLVRDDDFDAVCALIEGLGGEPEPSPARSYGVPGKGTTFHYCGVEVDVHRRVEVGVAPLSVDASRFFADELSQTVDLAGMPLRLPCLEMLFLHAVVHLASRQTRLSTMVDIARLASAPDFRPSMVNRLAAEEGLAGLVDWALGETRTLSSLELPVDGAAVVDWRQRWPTRFWLAHQTLGRAAQLLSNAPEGQRLVVVSRVVWPEQEFLEIAQRTRRNQLSYMVSLMRGVVLRGRARVPVQEGGLWR